MIHLLSFADSRMRRSLYRLKNQAVKMEVFDNFFLWNEEELPADFRAHFKEKLVLGSRGYGYWSWKPEIIQHALDKINYGDRLLYIDAGCHLNPFGRKRFLDYLDIVERQESGILAFQALTPDAQNSSLKYDGRRLFDQPNYRWIKGDLLDYFGARDNLELTNSQAIGAGVIFLRKCNQAISIIQEWRQIIWSRFDLLDDTPSSTPNLAGFIENRHDQSIWTLLCLKHKVNTLSAYEYWYPKKYPRNLKPDWRALRDFPIHAKRDKDLGWKFNAVTKAKRLLDRFTRFMT